MSGGTGKLLAFVTGMTRLVAQEHPEPRLLDAVDGLMRDLVGTDDWLPEAFAVPDLQRYQQYLLYGDPLERFSVVSFVWGPGQATPIHDHTVWGVIGMLRGAECGEAYTTAPQGGAFVSAGAAERLECGDTARVSPSIGDVHRVCNAFDDRSSISIHVYGGNIGRVRRHVFDPRTGVPTEFVSGYSNVSVPNLWLPG